MATEPEDGHLDLGTNVAQLFIELYRAKGVLSAPTAVAHIENALYAEGEQARSALQKASDCLVHFHRSDGTLDLYRDPDQPDDLQPFSVGCGSTQLFNALLYAMAMTLPDTKFLVVQKIPYFGSHRNAAHLFPYPNLTYLGFHTPADLPPKEPGTIVVEFVTSPNNPDGQFRRPEADPDVILGDFVFTSEAFGPDGTGYIEENLAWIREARAAGTPVLAYNSASKQFGHTGDRLGYMWYPLFDPFAAQIYDKFKRFTSTTVSVGLEGVNHFLDLLPFLEGEEGDAIRRETNAELLRRHQLVSDALRVRYPGSSDASVPGSPTLFTNIVDPRVPGQSAAEVVAADTNTKVLDGVDFGGTSSQIRVNIMAVQRDLDTFVLRLVTGDPSLSVDGEVRPGEGRVARACDPAFYAAPGQRLVIAERGCDEVLLPPWLGYEGPLELAIRNNNSHDGRPLRVRTTTPGGGEWCVRPCSVLRLVWEQPFYRNGRWESAANTGASRNNGAKHGHQRRLEGNARALEVPAVSAALRHFSV